MYDYYEAVSEAAAARAENELASDDAVHALRDALERVRQGDIDQDNVLERVPEGQRRRIIHAYRHMEACAGAALPRRCPKDMKRWNDAIARFDVECEHAGITPEDALDCL